MAASTPVLWPRAGPALFARLLNSSIIRLTPKSLNRFFRRGASNWKVITAARHDANASAKRAPLSKAERTLTIHPVGAWTGNAYAFQLPASTPTTNDSLGPSRWPEQAKTQTGRPTIHHTHCTVRKFIYLWVLFSTRLARRSTHPVEARFAEARLSHRKHSSFTHLNIPRLSGRTARPDRTPLPTEQRRARNGIADVANRIARND